MVEKPAYGGDARNLPPVFVRLRPFLILFDSYLISFGLYIDKNGFIVMLNVFGMRKIASLVRWYWAGRARRPAFTAIGRASRIKEIC
jgi:hypothetical protein